MHSPVNIKPRLHRKGLTLEKKNCQGLLFILLITCFYRGRHICTRKFNKTEYSEHICCLFQLLMKHSGAINIIYLYHIYFQSKRCGKSKLYPDIWVKANIVTIKQS